MMRLAEICPGKWVNPNEVVSVIAAPSYMDKSTWDVWVHLRNKDALGWNFDVLADAENWAKRIAERINGVLPPPDPATDAAAKEINPP